ncbi:MAG: type II toxin-antitoxin system HicA family toxin [Patescibacteria group bacterium]|jgi:predicted RNA binding protein YcfA (HicA-like mRNA interferase family)
MGDFGSVSWKKFEKFILAQGCVFKRTKGDHRVYTKVGIKRPVVVPRYTPLPAFIILNNLRVLGVTKEAFSEFLHKK